MLIWKTFIRLFYISLPFLIMLVSTPSEGFTNSDRISWFLFTLVIFLVMYGLYKLFGKAIITIPLLIGFFVLLEMMGKRGEELMFSNLFLYPLLIPSSIYSVGFLIHDVFNENKKQNGISLKD